MKQVVERCTCDRCGSTIEEKTGTPQSEVKLPLLFDTRGSILTRVKGVGEWITFDDLCEKCEARGISLIEAIAKTGKGKGKGKKKPQTKTVAKKNTTKPAMTGDSAAA